MPNDWYFEGGRQELEPVEAIYLEEVEGPYYPETNTFCVSAENLHEVKNPAASSIRLYQQYLQKVGSGTPPPIQLEIYLRDMLGITKPLQRQGSPNGTITLEPDSPIFKNSKQLFLAGWGKIVFDNNLIFYPADRDKSGLAGIDEVQASLIKAVITANYGNGFRMMPDEITKILHDKGKLEEIYEIIVSPASLEAALRRWFEYHPTQELPAVKYDKQADSKRDSLSMKLGRLSSLLGRSRVDEFERDIEVVDTRTSEERQTEEDFWDPDRWKNQPPAPLGR